tara:strand:- start:197 stop:1285 length:1089 start_codon:yes stop_codon:yes gene_type:complete
MDNRRRTYVLSKLYEDALNILVKGGREADIFEYILEIGQLREPKVEPCFECPYYYDYLKYSGLFEMFVIKKTMTIEELEIQLNLYKKAQLNDSAVQAIKESGKKEFSYVLTNPSKKVVYLDQNMLSDFSNDPETSEKLNTLKENYDFCYGPSHLEEINKILNPQDQGKMMDSITTLTGNLIILPTGDDYVFAFEPPHFGLKRVQSFPGGTAAVEEMRLVSASDRRLFLSKYEDDIHKKNIGNNHCVFDDLSDDSFKELLTYTSSSFHSKDHIKSFSGRDSYVHAIYTLFNSLDLLSYKIDTKDRTIRSGSHDIEHLISAGKADFFVTKDKKLYHRALQIYSFLQIDTLVLNQKDYIEALEAC